IAWNGADARCAVRLGDLRDPTLVEPAGYELVTGTPPYLTPGSARESARVQKGPCNFEHRGGIEAYCAAAVRALAPDGVFVTCAQAAQHARVHGAARAVGLAVTHEVAVVPRAGKAPLLRVHAMRPGEATTVELAPLVVRDTSAARTPAFTAVRAAMGLPP